ncbi:hypothetical protein BC832DRAFT_400288 [Gaertneriomyces semiglobifer]|nr:hypothetical protein BC832DRAFT_400288 [Gaertneriomyces semiglobifer]
MPLWNYRLELHKCICQYYTPIMHTERSATVMDETVRLHITERDLDQASASPSDPCVPSINVSTTNFCRSLKNTLLQPVCSLQSFQYDSITHPACVRAVLQPYNVVFQWAIAPVAVNSPTTRPVFTPRRTLSRRRKWI